MSVFCAFLRPVMFTCRFNFSTDCEFIYCFIRNKIFDSIIYMIGLFSSPNINTWKYIASSNSEYNSYYVRSTINKINITQNIKCMFFMLYRLIYTMKGEIHRKHQYTTLQFAFFPTHWQRETFLPNFIAPSLSFSLWIHHFSTCHTVVHISHKFPIQILRSRDAYTLGLHLYFKGGE